MTTFLIHVKNFLNSLVPGGSGAADSINRLFFQYLLVAGFIMLLVAGLVIWAVIRFRSTRRPDLPKQVFGSNLLEITWTLVPAALIAVFFFLTVHTMLAINKGPEDNRNPDIMITAHQWWWEMRYPQYGVITANELHIPVHRRLLMRVGSADVVHDWWVPALGRKIDAIPGHFNFSWIQADRTGEFEGTCSEYCGMQHAWMRIKVVAENPEKFREWILDQKKIPAIAGDSPAVRGARLFQYKSCASCHRIAGTPATADIGPDLTHIASRSTLLSGMMPNTPGNLRRWLEDPQRIKKGSHMPDFNLTATEIKNLVRYLEDLK